MSSIKVFWLEPTTKYRHELRRYARLDDACPAKPYGMTCHDARVPLGVVISDEHPSGYNAVADHPDSWKSDHILRDDARWPAACACGYRFLESDAWQVNYDQLHEALGGAHDGAFFTLRDAPPGAMWHASWLDDYEWATGPDGVSLHVKLPNGDDWCVDQECSNCTRTQWQPVDGQPNTRRWTGRTHYCWVRHGDPRSGQVHVDKNGDTCSAGAGSVISVGGWHGFLHDGHLVSC
jgi:hypothetical protein